MRIRFGWRALVATAYVLAAVVPAMAQEGKGRGRASGAAACRAAMAARQTTLHASSSQSSNTIDVVSYDITLQLSFSSNRVTARCDVGLRSLEDGLDQFTLDCVGLDVSSVLEDGEAEVSFTHSGGALRIIPSSPLARGEERVYAVSYAGTPEEGLYYSSSNGGVWYTFTEPEQSRYWFPCRDVPRDKAEWFRGRFVVPVDYQVASNGDLEGIIDNGDGTATWRYFHGYPISTYLIAVSVSTYQTFDQVSGSGVPIRHYVYPSHYDRAVHDWANLPAMVDFYSSVYHPYPFPTYGMVLAPIGGAMEHQTMTTMSPGLVTGNRHWEPVVAHELAHQWWGDMVTLHDWPDIWLNEGFATYFDALFTEHFYGIDAFRAQMDGNRQYYFNREPYEGRFPVYDPEYMWGATVYEKGSWVLHMLRHLLGTNTFQAIVREYADRFRFGNARTADLIAVCEEVSGRELSWFFDQWIFSAGYPEFRYTYSVLESTGARTFRLTVKQVQEDAPAVFVMPLDVGVTTSSGPVVFQVDVDDALVTAEMEVDGPVNAVEIDPNVWALATWVYVDLSGDLDGSGRVDGLDNARLGWAFGSSAGGGRWLPEADLNGDGIVDGDDLAILASHFGNSL